MIVMKFGGTSVQDASAMKKVLNIVKQNIARKPVVVLSACSGVTNQLIYLSDTATNNSNKINSNLIDSLLFFHLEFVEKLFKNQEIKDRANRIINDLIDDLRLLIDGIKLLNECTERSRAKILSYGEMLSTSIFNLLCEENKINSELIDVQQIIKTDNNFLEAKPNFKKINKIAPTKINKKFQNKSVVITQGFLGSNDKGLTTLLGRGGSDYSAAIIGSALNSEEIQIWTDVNGVLTADPRIIKNSKTINQMTFSEIRELAFYGAKVLHPDTIIPAVEKNIPVRILNTFNPKNTGTTIIDNKESKNAILRSVVLKEKCLYSKIKIPMISKPVDFYQGLLNQISDNDIKLLISTYTDENCL